MNRVMENTGCALVVDDTETDRYVIARRLRKRWPDLLVLEATDGRAAIELLETPDQQQPDMIFLDINMPRMSGHEFLESYYGDTGREIPVVMMLTSSDHEDDRRRAMRFGCVSTFVTKPIRPEAVDALPEWPTRSNR